MWNDEKVQSKMIKKRRMNVKWRTSRVAVKKNGEECKNR